MGYSDIEKEYIKVLKEQDRKIIELLDEVDKKLEEAKALSDKTGVPFQLNIWDDYETTRWYTPKKYHDLFADRKNRDLLEYALVELPDNYNGVDEDGWEAWHSSSLRC